MPLRRAGAVGRGKYGEILDIYGRWSQQADYHNGLDVGCAIKTGIQSIWPGRLEKWHCQ